jgi:hypothetical protein
MADDKKKEAAEDPSKDAPIPEKVCRTITHFNYMA